MWDYLIQFVISTVLAELFRPKPKVSKPAAAGLKDLGLPTVDETRPLPWLIGRAKIDAPNLIATYDFKATPRSKKQRSGFSSTTIPLGYSYEVGAVMMLCGGSGVRLREIWAGSGDDAVRIWSGTVSNGGTVTLDYSKTTPGQEDYPSGFKGVVEFFSGRTTPSSYVTLKAGSGNAPAWPHATYVVLRGATQADGMWVGTTGQVMPLSFVCERIHSDASVGLGAIPGDITKNNASGDSNPALAVAELLTDPIYWAGEHPDFINASTFWDAARVLPGEGQFVGALVDQQRTAADVAFEICRQIGAVLQPDPTTGNHCLKLLRATDSVVLTLTDSNIVSLDSFARSALDEATTEVTVNYMDRAAKWKQRPMTVKDRGAARATKTRNAGTQQYACINDATLAQVIAMRDLRTLSAPLATARLTAIVPKRQRLIPGDLVSFSSARNGINNLRMRVTTARFSQPGQGTCELELLEDVFSSGMAVYAQPLAATPPGSLSAPGPIGSRVFRWPYGFVAPRGLSGATTGNYHLVYFAGADSANAAQGYRLGFTDTGFTSNPDDAAWHTKDTIGFAAKGIVASDLLSPAIGNIITVAVSAADAETIRRNGSVEVLVFHDNGDNTQVRNWHKGKATMVTTTAAQIQLTGIKVYGNAPNSIYASDHIWLLYDFAVDPNPLTVTLYGTDTGNPATNRYRVVSAPFVRAQTKGAAGYGPWTLPTGGDYTVESGTAGSAVMPVWNTY